jgi:hypothetical protein
MLFSKDASPEDAQGIGLRHTKAASRGVLSRIPYRPIPSLTRPRRDKMESDTAENRRQEICENWRPVA